MLDGGLMEGGLDRMKSEDGRVNGGVGGGRLKAELVDEEEDRPSWKVGCLGMDGRMDDWWEYLDHPRGSNGSRGRERGGC